MHRALTAPSRAALSWAVLTLVVLAVPEPETPSHIEWVRTLADAGADKAVHALLFAVQAVLGRRWAAAAGLRAPGPAAWGATVLFGAATEALQLALPFRSAELADLLADGVGALIGVVAAAWHGASDPPPDW